jgi:uncharacterized protein (DUF58 family)
MVRQFEETRRSHLVLVLASDAGDYADAEEFELAISAMASLGLQAIKEEKDLTVITGGGEVGTRTATRLLDDCSRLEFAARPCPIEEVARVASNAVRDASVAVLLVGQSPDPGRLQKAITRFPQDVIVMVCQCVPGRPLARRAIGGTGILVLGELADLPRGMLATVG